MPWILRPPWFVGKEPTPSPGERTRNFTAGQAELPASDGTNVNVHNPSSKEGGGPTVTVDSGQRAEEETESSAGSRSKLGNPIISPRVKKSISKKSDGKNQSAPAAKEPAGESGFNVSDTGNQSTPASNAVAGETISEAVNQSPSTSKQMGAGERAEALPGWAAVAIGSSSAAVSVVAAMKIGEAIARGSKASVPEGQLSEELERAQRHVEELTAALEAQREAEHEAQREQQQSAPPAQGAEQVLPERSFAPEPSRDELVGEMMARTAAFERLAENTISGAASDFGAPQLLARASHVKCIVQDGFSDLREHVEELARQEGTALIGKVQQAMDVDLSILTGPIKIFEGLPPVGIIVAGVAAPMQLRSIKASAESSIFLNGILLSIGSGVSFVDWSVPCHDNKVWVWLLVLVGISFLLVFCHTLLRSKCMMALDDIAADQAKVDNVQTGNGMLDAFLAMKSSSGSLFKSLYRYDKIANSWAYSLTKFAGFAYLIWGGFGLYVTIADVVVDVEECNVRSVLFFMHFFSFFYLLLLTWFLFGQLLYLVQLLSGSTIVSTVLLKKAKEWDDSNPLQLPICLTLMRAFILRKGSDLLQVAKDQLQSEIDLLEEEAAQTNRRLAEKKAEAERLQSELSEACQNEEELIAKYEQQLQHSFDRAEPLVAMVASSSGEGTGAASSSLPGSSGLSTGGATAAVAAGGVLSSMMGAFQEQAAAVGVTAEVVGAMASNAASSFESVRDGGRSSLQGVLGGLQQHAEAVAAAAVNVTSSTDVGMASSSAGDMLGSLQQQVSASVASGEGGANGEGTVIQGRSSDADSTAGSATVRTEEGRQGSASDAAQRDD